MVKTIGIIVQAHMGSTRLSGKVLKDLCGKPELWHIVERLRNVKLADRLIIATSDLKNDDAIEEFCQQNEVDFFRGSDDDVLSRFYHAAENFNLTDIVRICSDNTLLDWEIIDKEIKLYLHNDYDIVTSGYGVPLGLGGEVFSFEYIKMAYENAVEHYQHEHVTPYIYENAKKIYKYSLKNDYSDYRLTLDTPEDWELVQKIYGELFKGKHDFLLDDIVKIMEENPEWKKINALVKQKSVKDD